MKLIQFICIASVILIFSGLIYVSVQQCYRQSANDPQIQIAEEIAKRLKENKSVDNYLFPDSVDLQISLYPFISIFDNSGKLLRSTGFINGQPPVLPVGVFNYTRKAHEDRITWQPQPGIRQAMVIVFNGTDFVAVGRSLKESDDRVSNLTTMVAICFILSIVIVLIYMLAQYYFNRRKKLI